MFLHITKPNWSKSNCINNYTKLDKRVSIHYQTKLDQVYLNTKKTTLHQTMIVKQ